MKPKIGQIICDVKKYYTISRVIYHIEYQELESDWPFPKYNRVFFRQRPAETFITALYYNEEQYNQLVKDYPHINFRIITTKNKQEIENADWRKANSIHR